MRACVCVCVRVRVCVCVFPELIGQTEVQFRVYCFKDKTHRMDQFVRGIKVCCPPKNIFSSITRHDFKCPINVLQLEELINIGLHFNYLHSHC